MQNLRKTNLQEFRAKWSLCLQCGACYYPGPVVPHNWRELPPPEWSSPTHKCPSFEYFKFRAYAPLGRANLATLAFNYKRFPVTDDLIKIVYTCTSCGMCSEICQRTQPLAAIWALREQLVQKGASLPAPLKKIEANIKQFSNIFGTKRAAKTLKGIPATGKDIYFAGCNARFREPAVAEATVKVLQSAGIDIANLGEAEKCCGFVPGHDGNTWLLEEMADQNMAALKKAGAKRVIVSCAHCYKTLKYDYPLIVGKLPFEVVHVAELLSKLVNQNKLKFTSRINKKITYHDPCFLGRHGNIYDEPRKVLESIPGIKLVEMERNGRWSHCCGSGAKISSSCYPQFTTAITRERLLEGKQAANTIVTACTSCFSHMDKAVKKEGMELKIYDLPTLVAEAMGIKT